MISVQIQQLSQARILLLSAAKLADDLGKPFSIVVKVELESEITGCLNELNISEYQIFTVENKVSLVDFCETNEVSFLFIQLTGSHSRTIRRKLEECRDLRIPYLLFKDTFGQLDLKKVLVPVNFLEEELEKAQFAAAFGRFCDSEIILMPANDYGSRAATNANKMKTLFDKFDFAYCVQKASKDSFKVEMEAVMVAEHKQAGLVIASASRDYGLDDIIFGPKEQHLVRKSVVPVLLINPRGDLYALCD